MIKHWGISDPHFGHDKILKYEERPFKNIEEMDKVMIDNWNGVVGKYDKVFVLGDVSFHHKERTTEIIKSLKGHKILIKGNHDKQSNQYWLDCGFQEVSKYPIILINQGIVLSHQPVENDIGILKNYHGHVHSNIENYEKLNPSKFKCVSVELIKYTPIQLF